MSNAVIEFTSQQGVMGGYYACAMGENDEVAHAIRDHYRPRFAGDELPEGTAGCIVACADKVDTIAGIFAIGEPPTGSSDPYALRRAAIGIINILRDRLPIDPTSLIDFALELYSEQGIEFDAAEVAQQVRDFFHGRLVSMARDEKIPADTVAAVSAVHIIARPSSSPAAPPSTRPARTTPRPSITWPPPMPAPRISPSPSWVRSTTVA